MLSSLIFLFPFFKLFLKENSTLLLLLRFLGLNIYLFIFFDTAKDTPMSIVCGGATINY